MSANLMSFNSERIVAEQLPDRVGSNVLAALLALVECAVDARMRPVEDLLKSGMHSKGMQVEEYLDVDELARRIHTEPKTIRDWVHKKKIPFKKLPTGSIRFSWHEVEAWIEGEQS